MIKISTERAESIYRMAKRTDNHLKTADKLKTARNTVRLIVTQPQAYGLDPDKFPPIIGKRKRGAKRVKTVSKKSPPNRILICAYRNP